MNIVIVTGGFDPLHSGHIDYLRAAGKIGGILIVGLNSDQWLERKKGAAFMPFNERKAVLRELSFVDQVIEIDDSDGSSKDAIVQMRARFPNSNSKIIFCNGGDRTKDNIPEMDIDDPNIEFVFGVGGENKKNSSSWILKQWSQPTTERPWGKYTVLDKKHGWQVKELEFTEGKSLSDQRHFKRSEHWCVVEGEIRMDLEWPDGTKEMFLLRNGESVDIPANVWHKATNVGYKSAKVIEVWVGVCLTEEDIERR